jgi:hypothetical protein
MRRPSRHLSATWHAFLAAHRHDIAAVDFFVLPTLTFRLLFGFVILRHDRRELLHIGVTDQPTTTWAAQQIAVGRLAKTRARIATSLQSPNLRGEGRSRRNTDLQPPRIRTAT